MWVAIGVGGLMYLLVLVTLGLVTLSKGHGWMFALGFLLPVVWLVGALMGPARGY